MKNLTLTLLILSACAPAKNRSVEPTEDDRLDLVKKRYSELLTEAEELRSADGWLVFDDCDSILWSGKYAASLYVEGVDLSASEYDGDGRFYRRPVKACWDGEDQGSKTTWSRDMGLGLIYGAVYQGRLDILERHAAYGEKKKWLMGEPFADGRVLYTPSIIGLLYQGIYFLGGEDNAARKTPNVYPAGLKDFQAHLQVLDIYLRGYVELGIRDAMLDRLKEHSEREPKNPFYAAVYSRYTGDYDKAVELCLGEDVGEYVRCEEFRRCQLAELINSCSIVLKGLNAK